MNQNPNPTPDGSPDVVTTTDAMTPDGTQANPDAGPDVQSGTVPPGELRGVVKRTQGLTFSGDGKGKLWIDIGSTCPYTGPIDVKKTTTVPNVDLTSPNAEIKFTMTGVAPGTYSVWGWLDDNGDDQPFPNGGDPGNFPMCPQVTLTANSGASVDLVFASSGWN